LTLAFEIPHRLEGEGEHLLRAAVGAIDRQELAEHGRGRFERSALDQGRRTLEGAGRDGRRLTPGLPARGDQRESKRRGNAPA
jgi:hypothetical protein